nr:SpoIID/LytB domain-containing protein [Ardenticatena sp.]
MQLKSTVRLLMPDGTVRAMPVEAYLRGVVPHEIGAGAPLEAQKAQAVAARCYALTAQRHPEANADLCTTTHCQVWMPETNPQSDVAIQTTAGVVALFQGRIIHALYFAACDGRTRSIEEVWPPYRVPYLRSVACPAPQQPMRGHGVGMCQTGAIAMATQGASFEAILQHFYTGIERVQGKYAVQPVRLVSRWLPPDEAGTLRLALRSLVGCDFALDDEAALTWRRLREERFTARRRAVAVELSLAGVTVHMDAPDGDVFSAWSGTDPAYGAGGLEMRAPRVGTYVLRIGGQQFPVQVENGLVVLTLQHVGMPMRLRLVSPPLEAEEANTMLAHLEQVVPSLFTRQ